MVWGVVVLCFCEAWGFLIGFAFFLHYLVQTEEKKQLHFKLFHCK